MAAAWLLFGALSLFVVSSAASGATKDYPPNEQPMYGGIQKTAAMKKADDEYIQRVLASGYTRQSGARAAVELGFRYFSKNDFATAMKRFNQAWLLDPGLGDTYHGFALVLIERDGNDKDAEAMFRKALSLPSTWAGAYSDYGRFLIMKERYAEAVAVLERGLAKDPNAPDARGRLAMALFGKGDYRRACAEARAALGISQPEERRTLEEILKQPQCR
jgi:tetratricopeptide (TPR) repeat protein